MKKPAAKIRMPAESSFPHLLYSSAEYHSDGAHLSLKGCLDQAKEKIRRHFGLYLQARMSASIDESVSVDEPVSVDGFWSHVRGIQHRDWPDSNATILATRLCDSAPTGITGFGPLEVAGAFYFEALQAYRDGNSDRSWAALLHCHHFLGMAFGQELPGMRSSKGGLKQAAPKELFREEFSAQLLKWLHGLPANKYLLVGDAIEELLPKAEAFRTAWVAKHADTPHGRATSLAPLMKRLITGDSNVRDACERILSSPIRRGRPAGSQRKKSAP